MKDKEEGKNSWRVKAWLVLFLLVPVAGLWQIGSWIVNFFV